MLYAFAVYTEIKNGGSNKSAFWHQIAESGLDIAVIDWCRVFGAQSDRTSFYKIISKTEFLEEFDDALFQEVSNQMRSFRNQSADGQEVDLIDVTGAIEVTEAFDRAVRKKVETL